MNNFLLGNGALFLASFIWGTAFVAQVTGMDLIGPFTFTMSRSILSAIFVFFLIIFQNKKKQNLKEFTHTNADDCSSRAEASPQTQNNKKIEQDFSFLGKENKKDLFISGLACGIFLFLGSSCQQIGLLYTTAGKTSFITSLYIVIIPIIGIFFKKKINLYTWLAVFLGTIGLYLLAIANIKNIVVNKGDFIVFIGAFFWAGHILVIDYFSKKVSPLKLSCFQFAVTTILSGIVAIFFENPNITNILLSWKAICYTGILSGGVAFTLQMIGQKNSHNPTLASLILSLESVFGALAGFIILNERLTSREILGCSIMFLAVLVAQIPTDFFKKKINT